MRSNIADLVVLVALALISLGAGMIYVPAAFIVGGLGLALVGIRMGTK